LLFKSKHAHAVSVSAFTRPQFGVAQSAGQPDHADGTIVGKAVFGGSVPANTAP
jgi:hypothetical protein